MQNKLELIPLNERLQAIQKMESIGVLAAGVAHDISNVLTVISGHATLALRKINSMDRARDDLNQILLAAERAGDIARQLLLFTRKQPMQFTPVCPNTLVQRILKMISRLIGEDITIETVLVPEPFQILADKSSLEQAIMNICVNARDAMPEGGKIFVRTSNENIPQGVSTLKESCIPGPYVCISIKDTGSGIDKIIAQRMFEPFFTTKELGKGTGLGLSTVKSIMMNHKGWVEVSSEPNQGAEFKLYIPALCTQQKTGTTSESGNDILKGNGERLLLIEDDDEVRLLTTHLLQNAGYVVFSAASIAQAKEHFRLQNGLFHGIITDVVLPDGRAPDFITRTLLTMGRDVPVIYSSGYFDDRSECKDICASGGVFLQKPYAPTELLKILSEKIQE